MPNLKAEHLPSSAVANNCQNPQSKSMLNFFAKAIKTIEQVLNCVSDRMRPYSILRDSKRIINSLDLSL